MKKKSNKWDLIMDLSFITYINFDDNLKREEIIT